MLQDEALEGGGVEDKAVRRPRGPGRVWGGHAQQQGHVAVDLSGAKKLDDGPRAPAAHGSSRRPLRTMQTPGDGSPSRNSTAPSPTDVGTRQGREQRQVRLVGGARSGRSMQRATHAASLSSASGTSARNPVTGLTFPIGENGDR